MNTCAALIALSAAAFCLPAHAEDSPFAPSEEIDVSAQAFARVSWGAPNHDDPARFSYGFALRAGEACPAALRHDAPCLESPSMGLEWRGFGRDSQSLWLTGAEGVALRLDTRARFQDEGEGGESNAVPWIVGGIVVAAGVIYLASVEAGDAIADGIVEATN